MPVPSPTCQHQEKWRVMLKSPAIFTSVRWLFRLRTVVSLSAASIVVAPFGATLALQTDENADVAAMCSTSL